MQQTTKFNVADKILGMLRVKFNKSDRVKIFENSSISGGVMINGICILEKGFNAYEIKSSL